MPRIYLPPRQHLSKPPVSAPLNTASTLIQSLLWYTVSNEGGGISMDMVARRPVPATVWAATPGGMSCLLSGGSSAFGSVTPDLAFTSGGWTAACLFWLDAVPTTAQNPTVFGRLNYSSETVNGGWELTVRGNTTTPGWALNCFANNGTLTYTLHSTAIPVAPGLWFLVGVSDGATTRALWLNGRFLTSSSTGFKPGVSTGPIFFLGGTGPNCRVLMSAAWNRVLLGAEIQTLYANPYLLAQSAGGARLWNGLSLSLFSGAEGAATIESVAAAAGLGAGEIPLLGESYGAGAGLGLGESGAGLVDVAGALAALSGGEASAPADLAGALALAQQAEALLGRDALTSLVTYGAVDALAGLEGFSATLSAGLAEGLAPHEALAAAAAAAFAEACRSADLAAFVTSAALALLLSDALAPRDALALLLGAQSTESGAPGDGLSWQAALVLLEHLGTVDNAVWSVAGALLTLVLAEGLVPTETLQGLLALASGEQRRTVDVVLGGLGLATGEQGTPADAAQGLLASARAEGLVPPDVLAALLGTAVQDGLAPGEQIAALWALAQGDGLAPGESAILVSGVILLLTLADRVGSADQVLGQVRAALAEGQGITEALGVALGALWGDGTRPADSAGWAQGVLGALILGDALGVADAAQQTLAASLADLRLGQDGLAALAALATADLMQQSDLLAVLGLSAPTIVRATYRALQRVFAFAAPARATSFAAGARATSFHAPTRATVFAARARATSFASTPRPPGAPPMAMTSTTGISVAYIRSGERNITYKGNFAPVLAAGETVLSGQARVYTMTAANPWGTPSDVTTTIVPGAAVSPATVPVSSDPDTGALTVLSCTLGPGAVTGMTYQIVFYATTSAGRVVQDSIDGISCDE